MAEFKLSEEDIKKIGQQLTENLQRYRKTLNYMTADAPIGVMCLPKKIERSLLNQGFLRVYDLLDCDLAKIEGIGEGGVKLLASSLDQFRSM